MKKIFTLAIAGGLLLMESCATNTSLAQPENEPGNQPLPASSAANYVILKDGTVQAYQSLKLVTGVFTSPHLLADGKTRIAASSICAYQNDEHYALSPSNLINSRRSKSAVESLPGFAVRIAGGRLNIYSQKYYNGSGTSEKLFIQVGNDGAVMAYSPELLNDILKEHPEAFNFFNSGKKIAHVSKKLVATAELFNNQQLLSRN